MDNPRLHKQLDEAQFEALFKSHFEYLCNFAFQYVKDSEAARDLTQKVFISLWEKRADMDMRLSIKSYLFTSVRNRCLNYLRDHKKYQSEILDIDCGNIDLSSEEDHFAVEELNKQIEDALNTLPEKCRLVFEMSRFQDKKYKEISEELGISQKTVEAHMSKAIKALRAYLKHYFIIVWLFSKY